MLAPRLSIEEIQHSSGYGPRTIGFTTDMSALFVGCKDGTLSIYYPLKPWNTSCEQKRLLSNPKHAGIKSICHLAGTWLAVGNDSGSVTLVNWQHDKVSEVRLKTATPNNTGPVTYVGHLARNYIIISHRWQKAAIYQHTQGPDNKPIFSFRRFVSARALLKSLQIDEDHWLFISESAEIWIYNHSEPETGDPIQPQQPWVEGGRPGFVSDVTIARTTTPGHTAKEVWPIGLFLTADTGIYALQWTSLPHGFQVTSKRVHLPGVTGMFIAATYFANADRQYLWVSDSSEELHLFWSENEHALKNPNADNWKRYQILEGKSQVTRAVASGDPDGAELLIGQVCRNDRVIISRFTKDTALTGDSGLDILLHAGLNELSRWISTPPRDPEAVVADLLEGLGDHPSDLINLLSNPTTGLPEAVLLTLGSEKSSKRVSHAITLWTHALLGTIHRRGQGRKGEHYLGMIRWLRSLGDAVISKLPEDQFPDALRTFEEAIQLVRKWGYFGHSFRVYAESRGSLTALPQLHDQDLPDHILDRLVYDTLLFRNQVDLEADYTTNSLNGDLALDAASTYFMGRELIAISWLRNGVETYERKQINSLLAIGDPPHSCLVRLWPDIPPNIEPQSTTAPPRNYCRSLVFSRFADAAFLLTAPLAEGSPPSFELRWLATETDLTAPPAATSVSLSDTGNHRLSQFENESVYSMEEIGQGLILVGLKGIRGRARFVLLQIRAAGELRILYPGVEQQDFRPAYPPGRSIPENAIRAIARDRGSKNNTSTYTAVVGCDDGQVFRVSLAVQDEHPWSTSGRFQIKAVTQVGRLSEAVSALEYCEDFVDFHLPDIRRSPRIIAGGAGGTIVAWQEITRDYSSPTFTPVDTATQEHFATLWTSKEQEGITSIHSVPKIPEEPISVVIAMTRNGKATLFYDSGPELSQPFADENQTGPLGGRRRPKVPGQSLGRINLGASVFASILLEPSRELLVKPPSCDVHIKYFDTLICRILVATGDGKLRISTLHYAKHTKIRHEAYDRVRSQWLCSLQDKKGRVCRHLLRQTEILFEACPDLTLILVRWILPPADLGDRGSWESRNPGVDRDWLPRQFRPLVDLETSWLAGEPLNVPLKESLRHARALEDKELFAEILEVVLIRANQYLIYGDQRTTTFLSKQYLGLFRTVADMQDSWLGWSTDVDLRTRTVIAQNLVDGDALWQIATNAQTALDRSAGHTLSDDPTGYREALRSRLGLIKQLLSVGDPLLALETIRSANMALLRACGRLERQKAPAENTDTIGVIPDALPQALPWNALQGYYRALGDFAARVVHFPEGGLGIALAHEVVRGYALGMLACPSAIIRLTHWMFGSDIPKALVRQIRNQLQLLQELLHLRMPPSALELFYAESGDSLEHRDPRRTDFQLLSSGSLQHWTANHHLAGSDNALMALEWKPFQAIVEWLHQLANQLVNEADKVDLLLASELHRELKAHFEGQEIDNQHFEHSYSFFSSALSQLEDCFKYYPDLGSAPGQIAVHTYDTVQPPSVRPETVLFSKILADWSRQQRNDLARRKQRYESFEPHHTLYDNALAAVERAAARFREGASVQKNVVLGVLGHGLIELLDEHLLQLWEAAQTLDPLGTWALEDGDDATEASPALQRRPTAEAFASYLLMSSRHAESISKNLRSLQGLLSTSFPKREALRPLAELLKTLGKSEGWELIDSPALNTELTLRECKFLGLTLAELAQNNRYHGLPKSLAQEQGKVPAMRIIPQSDAVEFTFYYDPIDYDRVLEVANQSLQGMVRARREPHYPSQGSGLYLANLAAASVGWKLAIPSVGTKTKGRLIFLLQRSDRMEPVS